MQEATLAKHWRLVASTTERRSLAGPEGQGKLLIFAPLACTKPFNPNHHHHHHSRHPLRHLFSLTGYCYTAGLYCPSQSLRRAGRLRLRRRC